MGPLEVLGLSPLGKAAREAAFAVRGDRLTPPSRWGPSSLGILHPRTALATWAGLLGRAVRIVNLVNRTPTPLEDGWSVRRTRVRDFRGGALTYDSHNGTDFACTPGTVVVAPAAGLVARVSSEFHRGGLKVFLDHGRGLLTSANHLSRALVREGERVRRAQPIALSGASGLDTLVVFPWGAPHVHFNVWLDGAYVDPFAAPGEVSLWRVANDPRPHAGPEDAGEPFEPTPADAGGLARVLEGCRDPALRAALGVLPPGARALHAHFHVSYFPTRFACRGPIFAGTHPREPRLDLPFRACDVDRAVMVDEM